MNNFIDVYSIDVNDITEKKGKLTYLSWANGWKEFMKVYPNATYTVQKAENGMCAFGNKEIGYMVYTSVTVDELTHEMWLPVMDFKNKSMMNPTTFDINKAVMRCLTKNLAMFGLGLYIYAGEDLPETSDTDREPQPTTPKIVTLTKKQQEEITQAEQDDNSGEAKELGGIKLLIKDTNSDLKDILDHYKVKTLKDLTDKNKEGLKKLLNKRKGA